MKSSSGQYAYSRTLFFTTGVNGFAFVSLINPFSGDLFFQVSSVKAGKAEGELLDATGKTVLRKSFDLNDGVNSLIFENTSKLPAGLYYLRLLSEASFIQKRVVKTSQ